MVKCKECGKEFEQKKSLRSHYIGKKDHDYDKEEFNNTYEEEGAGGSSGSPNSGQDKSDNSQEESIDRDDLKDKLEEMSSKLDDLSEKVRDLEDRELLNELEELGLEDQIATIESALGVRDPKQQKEKLERLGKLLEEWEDLKIPQKVNWLYKKYRELEESMDG